jgi:hypothetical protein
MMQSMPSRWVAARAVVLAAACSTSTPAERRRQDALSDAVRSSRIVDLQVPGGRLVKQLFSSGSARDSRDQTQGFETWRVETPTRALWYAVLADARHRGVTFSGASCGKGYTAGGGIVIAGTFVSVVLGIDFPPGDQVTLALSAGPASNGAAGSTSASARAPGATAPAVDPRCPAQIRKVLFG